MMFTKATRRNSSRLAVNVIYLQYLYLICLAVTLLFPPLNFGSDHLDHFENSIGFLMSSII